MPLPMEVEDKIYRFYHNLMWKSVMQEVKTYLDDKYWRTISPDFW